jgi:uncharacterized protein
MAGHRRESGSRRAENVTVSRARNGQGLFAARPFRAGQRIVRVTGRIVSPALVWKAGGTFMDNCFRFGPETYLDPGDGPGRYLNHSCEPNAGILKSTNRLFLVAIGAIGVRREILIDYSTILGDDDVWTMRCRCGARSCRRVVRNFGSLPAMTRDAYTALGIVPRYILNTLD